MSLLLANWDPLMVSHPIILASHCLASAPSPPLYGSGAFTFTFVSAPRVGAVEARIGEGEQDDCWLETAEWLEGGGLTFGWGRAKPGSAR
jgi:hypothetical protein